MNIIIPLGGKGERFLKEEYKQPKPLIPIFDKTMIEYVLDNLKLSENDTIFIIYNENLDNYNFCEILQKKYLFINFIKVPDTKGAVETLLLGISQILNNFKYNIKSLILDCDTFYTEDIISIFRESNNNLVFYTKNYEKSAIYSYIELENEKIIDIKEKIKISDNANTGVYAFNDIKVLYNYCKHVIDNNILFNGEPYTSCVISEMIKNEILFIGYELIEECVFSLGTPEAVNKYIDRTYAFLFDLDGTLVLTDKIYYYVWSIILKKYNIELTDSIYSKYIQGNNDSSVHTCLLSNENISLCELSEQKDELFIENIEKIRLIEGVYQIMDIIKKSGYKICIVTNCNKRVAYEVIEKIGLNTVIDFVITSTDCLYGKPNIEPYKKAIERYGISNDKCIIFEDSKTGILSGKGVNPKLLIGIETIYNSQELLKHNVDISIKNYIDFDISICVNDVYNELNNTIMKNSIITDIKEVIIDRCKLKGGFIADVISFKINTVNNECYSQILKYENIQENGLSMMAKQLQLYEREYYFYTHISKDVPLKIPYFYNLIKAKDNTNNGIVLENLIEKGYKINLDLNDEKIGVSFKIIDRMALMHSLFWNKKLEDIYPNIKKSTSEIFYPFLPKFIDERYPIFKENWYPYMNESQKIKCDEMYRNFEKIQQKFSYDKNLTFIHGDIKSPNIFYDTKNNNEPYFIDWQHCGIGKGTQDLIFFIIESFDISIIKQVFDIFTKYYYEKLLEYGITDYSNKEYYKDLYDSVNYIPFFTSIWFGTIPQDELIDKDFPKLFIKKLFYVIELFDN